MTQALYRKWRPRQWDEVIGQDHVIQTLRNAVIADRVSHAYLFAGPRGTGKTTLARLLAKAVNCEDPDPYNRPCDACEPCLAVNQGRFLDLIEIDAASNTSVEDVRDLRDKINFAPNQGDFKVYVIDEVHMLSTAAFNALLKTLEEPPPHAKFVLATTEVHKIPATVLSRCQQHEFRRIPVTEMVDGLKTIAEEEGISAETNALTLIARQATGSMRDAISLLDQLASSGERITLEMAEEVLGTVTSQVVLNLVDALVAQETGEGLTLIHKTLDAGSEPRQFARQVVHYLRDLLLIRMENVGQTESASDDIRTRRAEHALRFETSQLLRAIRIFNQAATEERHSWQPGLPLELAFVEALTLPKRVESFDEGEGQERKTTTSSEATSRRRTPPTVESLPSSTVEEESEELGLGLRKIRTKWDLVLEGVKKYSNPAQGLLNSCNVLEIRGHDLYLGFATDVLKSMMEKSDNTTAVERALKEVFGEEIRIRCVIATGAGRVPPEVEGDSMVAAAIRLGGEIVDSQDIKPNQEKKQQ